MLSQSNALVSVLLKYLGLVVQWATWVAFVASVTQKAITSCPAYAESA